MRRDESGGDEPDGIGTILVGRQPFKGQDLDLVDEVVNKLGFEVVLSPALALDDTFARLAAGKDLRAFTEGYPINIEPPTDDAPFFFNMLRLRHVLRRDLSEQGRMSINMKAVVVLGVLLVTVIGLTLLCIILPLALTTKPGALRGFAPALHVLRQYRAWVHAGRNLADAASHHLPRPPDVRPVGRTLRPAPLERTGELVDPGRGIVRLIGAGDRPSRHPAGGASGVRGGHSAPGPSLSGVRTAVRIALAAGTLFPVGLFLGMAFPLGMTVTSSRAPGLTPWLWGINGATSVCASVVGVAIALSSGISTAFWAGFACYAAALLSFLWMSFGGRARGPERSLTTQEELEDKAV